jgi:hypothetical protein
LFQKKRPGFAGFFVGETTGKKVKPFGSAEFREIFLFKAGDFSLRQAAAPYG